MSSATVMMSGFIRSFTLRVVLIARLPFSVMWWLAGVRPGGRSAPDHPREVIGKSNAAARTEGYAGQIVRFVQRRAREQRDFPQERQISARKKRERMNHGQRSVGRAARDDVTEHTALTAYTQRI